jgi:hypothetical protein
MQIIAQEHMSLNRKLERGHPESIFPPVRCFVPCMAMKQIFSGQVRDPKKFKGKKKKNKVTMLYGFKESSPNVQFTGNVLFPLGNPPGSVVADFAKARNPPDKLVALGLA